MTNNFGGLDPLTTAKLYWACIVPKLVYGLHLVSINDKCLRKLEQFHIFCAKRIQGLPQHSPSEGVLPQLGWITLKGYMDKLLLQFLFHICKQNNNSIVKRVFLSRVSHIAKESSSQYSKSPASNIINCARKYCIYSEAMVIMNVDGDSPYIRSKIKWKTVVDKAVMKHETDMWKSNVLLFPKLIIYKSVITMIDPCVWWRIAKQKPELSRKCKVLMKMLCNVYGFMTNRCKYDKSSSMYGRSNICKMCGEEVEDLIHCLFLCLGYANERLNLYDKVREICDIELVNLNVNERVLFLFGSCSINGVDYNVVLAEAILRYIHDVHTKRSALFIMS